MLPFTMNDVPVYDVTVFPPFTKVKSKSRIRSVEGHLNKT